MLANMDIRHKEQLHEVQAQLSKQKQCCHSFNLISQRKVTLAAQAVVRQHVQNDAAKTNLSCVSKTKI